MSNDKHKFDLADCECYCPVCGRVLRAVNIGEVESGEHDGYIFVHDEVPHGPDDARALYYGIQ